VDAKTDCHEQNNKQPLSANGKEGNTNSWHFPPPYRHEVLDCNGLEFKDFRSSQPKFRCLHAYQCGEGDPHLS
jgi:hypothetical protein